MTTSLHQLHLTISKAIPSSSRNNVVLIDGYAGSGKSTIASTLVNNYDRYTHLSIDSFIVPLSTRINHMTSNKPHKVKQTFFRYGYFDFFRVMQTITAFLRHDFTYRDQLYDFQKKQYTDNVFSQWKYKDIMLVEGVFSHHPKNHLINIANLRVFVETASRKIADDRRIEREKRMWGSDYLPENSKDNWMRYFTKAYEEYTHKYNPSTFADIVYTNL